jgi:hypothetical protein
MHVPDEGIVYTQGFADPAQRAKGIAWLLMVTTQISLTSHRHDI